MADQKDPFQNAVLTEAKEPESMAGARLSGPASKYGVGGSSRVHPVVGGQKEMDLSDEEEQEELMQETFAERTQSTARFNVSPHSWSTQVWDAFMAVLLIFVAIWTPAEVSFVEVAGGVTPLFVLNRVVDSCFCVDMVRQFFIPFYDEVTRRWVGNYCRIAYRYVTTWFAIDLVSIIPFDLIAMQTGTGGTLRVIRVVRLLRLIKLLRALKSLRILKRYQNQMSMSYAKFQLIAFLLFGITLAHWTACLWHLASTMHHGTDNWVTNYGIQDSPPLEKYIASFYWAIMTLTTIGYGDISAVNYLEHVVATLTMILGGAVYAYVVGGICGIFANMNPDVSDYHNTMDALNRLMADYGIDPKLRASLREYFRACKLEHREKYNRDVIALMSPGLKLKFSGQAYHKWICNMPYFSNNAASDSHEAVFTARIASKMQPMAFPAREAIITFGEAANSLYVVRDGLVGLRGKLLRKAMWFGKDMICGAPRRYTAMALIFTRIMGLSRADVFEVAAEPGFEAVKSCIVSAARWMKVRTALKDLADEIRIMRSLQLSGGLDKVQFQALWEDHTKTNVKIHLEGGVDMTTSRLKLLSTIPDLGDVLAPLLEQSIKVKTVTATEAAMDTGLKVGDMSPDDLTALVGVDRNDQWMRRMDEMMEEQAGRLGRLEDMVGRVANLVEAT